MVIHRLKKILKLIIFKIWILFLTLIFLVVFPPIVLLLLPIFIFRYFVKKIATVFRKDLSKMLSTRSMIYGVDEINTNPTANLIITVTIQGDIDLEGFKKLVIERGLNWTNKNGDIATPELKQYIVQFMGFLFWKNDKSFNIDNHVYVYKGDENEVIDERKVKDIERNLLQKPNIKKRSPWEVVLIKKYIPKKKSDEDLDVISNALDAQERTVIAIKWHHTLGDGYSMARLIATVSNVTNQCNPPLYNPPRMLIRILMSIAYWIRAPFEIVEHVAVSTDKNEWHNPKKKLRRRIQLSYSPRITLDYLREIKNRHRVSLTSLMLAAFGGAVRRYMINTGIKLPTDIRCAVALPMPFHPDNSLRNYMTAAMTRLKISEPDPYVRLRLINEYLNKLRRSTVPQTVFNAIKLSGGLITPLVRPLAQNNFATAILSNFPGPDRFMTFMEKPVLDISFGSGLLSGSTGIILTALSYNGAFKQLLEVDRDIIPTDTGVEELMQFMMEELEILRKDENDDV